MTILRAAARLAVVFGAGLPTELATVVLVVLVAAGRAAAGAAGWAMLAGACGRRRIASNAADNGGTIPAGRVLSAAVLRLGQSLSPPLW